MKTPVVVLCNESFLDDGELSAARKGMPGLRLIPETIPCESSVREEAEKGIDQILNSIIEGLIKPLSKEEESPTLEPPKTPPRIIFKGDLEEVNRFYYKRGLTDGLPIIPPTEEAVAEMLTGTDLPPDHLLGTFSHRLGKATIEKIAINAVMAGALPTYMPVLIAAVKALFEPNAFFGTYQVSTGSWTPFWIINGPVRNHLRINSGSGALSPGDIANAAIGRAMSLIISNIGGARKGLEDMGVFGNPGKYTMVIAENEEDSSWEPMHVEYGFDKQDSTVTVSFPNCFSQSYPYGSDDQGMLKSMVYNVLPSRSGLVCILLPPPVAKALAEKGWTKPEIRNFVSTYARVPADHHPSYWGASRGVIPKETVPLNPSDPVPIFQKPEWIRIIVAGGPGSFIGQLTGSAVGKTDWVTQKIELPANWDKLVKKHKNIVPSYRKD
ncbi:hypothetical protein ACFL7M_03875 [Thermodesulfobacteriota bacterium]